MESEITCYAKPLSGKNFKIIGKIEVFLFLKNKVKNGTVYQLIFFFKSLHSKIMKLSKMFQILRNTIDISKFFRLHSFTLAT